MIKTEHYGLACPQCGGRDTDVKDSRPLVGGTAIRRRRLCPSCGTRFTTFERNDNMVGNDLSFSHRSLIRVISRLPARDAVLLLSVANRLAHLNDDGEEENKPREDILADYDELTKGAQS